MVRKIKIIMACWATVVVVAIIVAALLVLLGFQDKIETFFYVHFTGGAALIFIILWPVYSKRLK